MNKVTRKKQRSYIRQKRKLKQLIRNIDMICPFNNTSRDCEHFHVPSDMFIEREKTYDSIKSEFLKKWLDKTEKIIKQKPKELEFCKVIAMIDEPNYWSSQIIIFYDREYYNTFWDRNTEYQVWNEVDSKEISFIKDRNIETNLLEKGYEEIICDEDFSYKSKLWFYGDVNTTEFE